MASPNSISFGGDILAPIVRAAIAPAWARWERSPYLKHLRALRNTQFQPRDVILGAQWEALRKILLHGYEQTTYYRERFDEAGVNPRELDSVDDLLRVPLLTKADLRERPGAMVALPFRGIPLHVNKTSGSTGVSVQVKYDEITGQLRRAMTLRSDEWSRWRLGERVAAVWGNPEYVQRGWRGRLRNVLLERATYLDTLKMDESAMRRFADTLRRRPPSLLFGHAHSLYLFARFLRFGGDVPFRPKGIISSAMVLHDWEREVIEDVFGTPVTNRYGCEEVSLIACECEQHNGLHVNADGVFVEIIRADGSPAQSGERGAVVVTDLVNYAMPMIRYQIGDMATATDRECGCGRGLPLIERVEGRIADYVVTPTGEMISGISLTENFAMLIPGLVQLQIVQETASQFVFRIVRGADFGDESLQVLEKLVRERFGCGVEYECDFVDRILPEPSGKYRFCVSKVPNPFSSVASSVSK